MTPNIDIQQMKPPDLATLCKICCEIYCQNFSKHWHEGGLDEYINKVFGADTLQKELCDKNIQYYVGYINKEPVAFMKINLLSNLPGLDMEKGIELDKMYVLPQFKGMKIGKRLLDIAFDIANIHHKQIFWLSVIDTNKEAILFYEKAGFRFHSTTRIEYPKFKEELRGMWRMYVEVTGYKDDG